MEPEGSRTAYDGHLFDVVVEEWGGHEREIVDHPGATAIVAIDSDGCVTLVRQLREPVRKPVLELPAGTLEPGEEPLASGPGARRAGGGPCRRPPGQRRRGRPSARLLPGAGRPRG